MRRSKAAMHDGRRLPGSPAAQATCRNIEHICDLGSSRLTTSVQHLAETEGFEPSIPVIPVWRFSKPLVSATHPRLRRGAGGL